MKQEKIFTLLNEMSLDEKIGQLIQLSGEFFSASDIPIGPIEKLGISKKMVNLCGSPLKCRRWRKIIPRVREPPMAIQTSSYYQCWFMSQVSLCGFQTRLFRNPFNG